MSVNVSELKKSSFKLKSPTTRRVEHRGSKEASYKVTRIASSFLPKFDTKFLRHSGTDSLEFPGKWVNTAFVSGSSKSRFES